MGESGAFHVIEYERRTTLIIHAADFDVVHSQPFRMSDEKAVRWNDAEHRRFGIVCLSFRRVKDGLLARAATTEVDAHVTESHVLDIVPRNAADNRSVTRIDIVLDDIADINAAQLTPRHANPTARAKPIA